MHAFPLIGCNYVVPKLWRQRMTLTYSALIMCLFTGNYKAFAFSKVLAFVLQVSFWAAIYVISPSLSLQLSQVGWHLYPTGHQGFNLHRCWEESFYISLWNRYSGYFFLRIILYISNAYLWRLLSKFVRSTGRPENPLVCSCPDTFEKVIIICV